MKFSINKDEIIHQLQSLAAVADKKQTLPILSNIYLKCSSLIESDFQNIAELLTHS